MRNKTCVNISIKEIKKDDENISYHKFCEHLFISHKARELNAETWPAELRHSICAQQFALFMHQLKTHQSNIREYVILYRNEFIGRLILEEQEDLLHIIYFAILPKNQNKGIGALLLRSFISDAKTRNSSISLEVSANNSAISLYKKLGFSTIEKNEISQLMIYK